MLLGRSPFLAALAASTNIKLILTILLYVMHIYYCLQKQMQFGDRTFVL
jgi:hypothetical protein